MKNKPNRPLTYIEQLMGSAIEAALTPFGEEIKELIYQSIEKSSGIPRSMLPCNIEKLSIAIEKVFGEGGQFLEFIIMHQIRSKLGTVFKLDQTEVEEYLISASVFSKKIFEIAENRKLPTEEELGDRIYQKSIESIKKTI